MTEKTYRTRLDHALAAVDVMIIHDNYASFATGDTALTMREVLATLAEAGRNERARLPPTRRIEVEQWAVINRAGNVVQVYASKANAEFHYSQITGHIVVKLTGTATIGD